MTTVNDLIRQIGLIMAATVYVHFGYAAPSSTDSPPDGAGSVDGMTLYQAHCAACHDGQVPRAPHMITFSTIGADPIV